MLLLRSFEDCLICVNINPVVSASHHFFRIFSLTMKTSETQNQGMLCNVGFTFIHFRFPVGSHLYIYIYLSVYLPLYLSICMYACKLILHCTDSNEKQVTYTLPR